MTSKKEQFTEKLLTLERVSKWVFIISSLIMAYCWFYKDILPHQSFYNQTKLNEPIQTITSKAPFYINTHEQKYLVTPQFDYELDGVIVTYNNADQFGNIWHTKRWKDFINLRDLCVIWGNNVNKGNYHDMDFSSDSWTCWVSPKNRAAWEKFSMLQLSNNHVLIDNEAIKKKLMSTEKGDQIRFKGMLVNYKNENNDFSRGTSITRDDTGNGACETVYLTSFEIIKKANKSLRKWYTISQGIVVVSFISFFMLLCITPKRRKRRSR